VIARAVVFVAAVAAIAVLAGRLSVARDLDRAVTLTQGDPTAADLDEAARLFGAAAARTRDTTPLLRRGQLELVRGRPAGAAATARRIVAAEPGNAEAWLLLAQAARTVDPALARQARARVAALVASGR
jgi:hypothetical protein